MIRWEDQGHRILAISGDAPIGAVFPGVRRVRWRAWVTKNMNPVEGTAKNLPSAKAEVERRFAQFVDLAGLEQK